MRAVTCLLVAGACRAAELDINWNAGFSDPAARNQTAAAGDSLKFTWTGGHNVYRLASKDAFDNCDFTDAANLGAASPVSVQQLTDLDANNAAYFACRVGSHCSSGQKLSVYFGPSSPTATTAAPITTAVPTEAPGNPNGEPSAASKNSVATAALLSVAAVMAVL